MSYSPEVPPNLSLIDRVVVITGAARGMGRAHVETCIEAGASVVLTDVLDDLGTDLCGSLPNGRAVYVHAGSIRPSTRFSSRPVGSGSCTM